jgi:two-component system chemotaxis response regulator CheV
MEKDTQKGILTETGTNEVEMLEFVIHQFNLGINVSKVRSFFQLAKCNITNYPKQDERIIGLIDYSGETIPVIDMKNILLNSGYFQKESIKKIDDSVDASQERLILAVLEFNKVTVGVILDQVKRIHRISWLDFVPLKHSEEMVLGSFEVENQKVIVLDIEKIIGQIFPESKIESTEFNSAQQLKDKRGSYKVVHIDDSAIVRDIMRKSLVSAGYNNLVSIPDGKKAYDIIKKFYDNETSNSSYSDIFIIDIEMPQMDGLSLCKKIRTEFKDNKTIIIMFSSLINEQMIMKCKSVGATDQISKPEIPQLVTIIDKLLEI